MRLRISVRLLAMLVVLAPSLAEARGNPEAVLLNNRGVAQMGQQFIERAAASFAEAFQKDPRLAQASINEGIALFYLQRAEEASTALQAGLKLNPASAQGWYSLGLVEHAATQPEAAIESFQHVLTLDPFDSDSYYYEGVCYQQLKRYDQALAAFTKALQINPLHASSEFALARTLQRLGRTQDAEPHLQRFLDLTSKKVATAMGLTYGEQGHYAITAAIEVAQASPVSMPPVQLRAESLLSVQASAGLTGGACMLDVTGTGAMDLILLRSGTQAIQIMHRLGNGAYSELSPASTGLSAHGHAIACTAGDYDGDGLTDLAVALDDRMVLFHNLGHGHFNDATAETGIGLRNHPTGITFVDFDHDGDLDLFLTGASLTPGAGGNVLWRNNGNGTFTEWSKPTGLDGATSTTAAILTDFNNDRAVDIAVAGGVPLLYVNPREGKYTTQVLYDGTSLPFSAGIATLDFNKDGWMDVAVTHTASPGLTLWRNIAVKDQPTRAFEQVKLPLADAVQGWGVTSMDVDNDGWLDLAALVQTASGPQVRILRNTGQDSFEDISHSLGMDKVKLTQPRGLIAADFDPLGAAGLLITQLDAPPILIHGAATRNHSVRIGLTGYADNKTAIGSKVEVFAGDHWQKFEITGSSGLGTQGSPEIVAGLGEADQIDLLRILWPTGVFQDEIDLPRQPVISVKEADRRGSSCPVLFAWNGGKYALVTDVIGAAVIGHWFTPTRRNTPRPGEWIKIEGSQLVPADGKLSLRFIEPMEEVNYVDQLRLVAVDHPDGVQVNPDERFLDDPPFATGQVIASESTHVPRGAWDGTGREVSTVLAARDHLFASGFTPTPYDGFANAHTLTLDLGPIQPGAPLRLLMTGYVNYFSATSLYAAWQAGIKPVSPYAEAQLANGSWQRIADDIGFPAGLERTITVDLTGKIPAGAQRIRITTNLEIYWDQILIDNHPQAQSESTEIPLAAATLHFRGYPKQSEGSSPGDLNYDYNQVSLTGPFQHQRGNYTRLGDVTPLVTGMDDHFVIFGSGEEIAAEFDPSNLPPLKPNWKRDYFFYANGFVKDMDWWDASPFTVTQLPFHGMSSYPYPATESYPKDRASTAYQLDWNDRFDSGLPNRSYRFQYRPAISTPLDDQSIASPRDREP